MNQSWVKRQVQGSHASSLRLVRSDADIMLFPKRLPVSDAQLRRVAAQARRLADQAYDDVRLNGDDPVLKPGEWQLFHRFPVVTRNLTSVWRMMAARSFDDLAEELQAGSVHPHTLGEHVALSLVLNDCKPAVDHAGVLAMRGQLVDEALVDALHDPASPQARRLGADPDIWFAPLIAGRERDPGRGFRGWQ